MSEGYIDPDLRGYFRRVNALDPLERGETDYYSDDEIELLMITARNNDEFGEVVIYQE